MYDDQDFELWSQHSESLELGGPQSPGGPRLGAAHGVAIEGLPASEIISPLLSSQGGVVFDRQQLPPLPLPAPAAGSQTSPRTTVATAGTKRKNETPPSSDHESDSVKSLLFFQLEITVPAHDPFSLLFFFFFSVSLWGRQSLKKVKCAGPEIENNKRLMVRNPPLLSLLG